MDWPFLRTRVGSRHGMRRCSKHWGLRAYHVPVMLNEVVAGFRTQLASQPRPVLVDCTTGGGGHSAALLEAIPHARLLCLDRDPDALEAATERLKPFEGRVFFAHASFAELPALLAAWGIAPVDGLLADLGISSWQIDHSPRGFSFRAAGPLDMRFDQRFSPQSGPPRGALCFADAASYAQHLLRHRWQPRQAMSPAGISGARAAADDPATIQRIDHSVKWSWLAPGSAWNAADLVEHLPEALLTAVLRDLGDEPSAARVAAAIVSGRQIAPGTVQSTRDLEALIARALAVRRPASNHSRAPTARASGQHTATKCFQALRTAVNDELGHLTCLLHGLPLVLSSSSEGPSLSKGSTPNPVPSGGLAAFITFQSLEDVLVVARARSTAARVPPSARYDAPRPSKSQTPAAAEVAANPRSRSARLRWIRWSAMSDADSSPSQWVPSGLVPRVELVQKHVFHALSSQQPPLSAPAGSSIGDDSAAQQRRRTRTASTLAPSTK